MAEVSSGSSAHWAEQRSRHGGVDEIPLPGELRGRLFLCGKQFIGPDPEAALAHVGATTVVCLNEAHELTRYPSYVHWLRAQPEDRLVWWPVPDLGAPPPAEALELLGQLRARLERGERLLLHCGAGIGRAGTIAAALLVTLGAPPEAAIDHVRAHRPLGGPEAGAQSELVWSLAGQAPPA